MSLKRQKVERSLILQALDTDMVVFDVEGVRRVVEDVVVAANEEETAVALEKVSKYLVEDEVEDEDEWQQNCEKAVELAAHITVPIKMRKYPDSEAIQRLGVNCILHLLIYKYERSHLQYNKLRDEMLVGGVVHALVNALRRFPNSLEIQRSSTRVLGTLLMLTSTDDHSPDVLRMSRMFVEEMDGIALVLAAAETHFPNDHEIIMDSCNLFRHLATCPILKGVMEQAGVVRYVAVAFTKFCQSNNEIPRNATSQSAREAQDQTRLCLKAFFL